MDTRDSEHIYDVRQLCGGDTFWTPNKAKRNMNPEPIPITERHYLTQKEIEE
jgi:hypothetical protein